MNKKMEAALLDSLGEFRTEMIDIQVITSGEVLIKVKYCEICEYCLSSDYGVCEDYNIIGTGSNGAFAEYITASKKHVLRIEDSLDFETAAGIEPATIAYYATKKAEIQPGESVVVMGCGPIGQFTIQWQKYLVHLP